MREFEKVREFELEYYEYRDEIENRLLLYYFSLDEIEEDEKNVK